MFCCLVKKGDEEQFSNFILQNTTSWGVRIETIERKKLSYRFVACETKYGKITIKIHEGNGFTKYKIENDDAAAAAQTYKVSIDTVKKEVIRVYEQTRNV